MAEYTVVGFIDESGDVQVAGVIEGRHAVTQSYYDRWWIVAEASTADMAGAQAAIQIEKQLEKEEADG